MPIPSPAGPPSDPPSDGPVLLPADEPVEEPAESAGEAAPGATALPEAVRRRVLDLAAGALGSMPPQEVPPSLVRVRSFTPARRAERGAVPLLTTLERDEAFRARVASAVRGDSTDLATAVDAGSAPEDADMVEVAAAAYLLRPATWPSMVDRASRELARAEQERADRVGQELLSRARAELELARAERGRNEAAAREELAALQEELADVRRELRRHRSDADRARALTRSAQNQAEEIAETAEREVEAARERAERAEAELRAAREELMALRRADREGRSLAGARARLLLDTVLDAAAGLRSELALPPAGLAPADLVGSAETPSGAAVAARARAADDPAVLDELLRLPRPHLVVDGYNVTKSAYGELPLADQRARLLGALSSLAARTRAEITCCFDGADLPGRTPTPTVRGVRVRFSADGEIADDLIRRLVRAEPPGRVVVVVSSDREVADDVRALGARPVPSAALVRLLARS
ncbi:MAG TPA: NYN domain-containing protein [Actinomycetales bacterium]|nr:NYN domain-containing protein [Actinomycetales bacterium]